VGEVVRVGVTTQQEERYPGSGGFMKGCYRVGQARPVRYGRHTQLARDAGISNGGRDGEVLSVDGDIPHSMTVDELIYYIEVPVAEKPEDGVDSKTGQTLG
jgi:hypothetical protein